ncbi:MAG: hypothetical protein M3Z25_11770 [Actinomycetota bacterium]|nr:hypothetical protein [Actinomycetota bacterium]
MTMYTSAITTATVRRAGEIPVDIAITHLGAPEQEASMRLGELLVYVREPAIAAMVAAGSRRQSRRGASAVPAGAAARTPRYAAGPLVLADVPDDHGVDGSRQRG